MLLKQKNSGLHRLDVAKTVLNAVSYRVPIPVVQIRLCRDDGYPVCPRCNNSFDREYTQFCDRCGQRLSWKLFRFTRIEIAGKK